MPCDAARLPEPTSSRKGSQEGPSATAGPGRQRRRRKQTNSSSSCTTIALRCTPTQAAMRGPSQDHTIYQHHPQAPHSNGAGQLAHCYTHGPLCIGGQRAHPLLRISPCCAAAVVLSLLHRCRRRPSLIARHLLSPAKAAAFHKVQTHNHCCLPAPARAASPWLGLLQAWRCCGRRCVRAFRAALLMLLQASRRLPAQRVAGVPSWPCALTTSPCTARCRPGQ